MATQDPTVASPEAEDSRSVEQVGFKYHPRLIRALGAELVTSDIVAIIELVKNSYDAFAHNVSIRFAEDSDGEYIEIKDDGVGMTREVIEDAWFTVATPHKVSNHTARLGARQRRVSGDKGLGRLSAARLGDRLEMITRSPGGYCWRVEVQWDSSSNGYASGGTAATISEVEDVAFFPEHGTRIRIYDLCRRWSDRSFVELRESLARLLSPFSTNDEFNITLYTNSSFLPDAISVDVPEFLNNPPYTVTGAVDATGNVVARYRHMSDRVHTREKEITISWSETLDSSRGLSDKSDSTGSKCGEFSFEIRAWDLEPEERRAIADRFRIRSTDIRKAIGVNKGISLYRDGVLVLPKTDHGKDWLGLDTRRVQRVGSRIGTRNVIGSVNIRADKNPEIKDTSDREALASNIATDEFRCILMAVVSRFEVERDYDREPIRRINDVFSGVSADAVLDYVRDLQRRNAPVSDIVSAIQRHAEEMERTREALRVRFVYYSRIAALGQMAHMLVHEVRNRTTSIGAFLRRISATVQQVPDHRISRSFELATDSVDALTTLANTFAPLASRTFRRTRQSVVEKQMHDCLGLLSDTLQAANVRCYVPRSKTRVAVDPGEMTHVLYNIIDNAIYWLGRVKDRERIIEMTLSALPDTNKVLIRIADNGPGINPDDEERVFIPGFTMKPHGTGMGLTVASELVAAWGGQVRLEQVDDAIGACFAFDAPVNFVKES